MYLVRTRKCRKVWTFLGPKDINSDVPNNMEGLDEVYKLTLRKRLDLSLHQGQVKVFSCDVENKARKARLR